MSYTWPTHFDDVGPLPGLTDPTGVLITASTGSTREQLAQADALRQAAEKLEFIRRELERINLTLDLTIGATR